MPTAVLPIVTGEGQGKTVVQATICFPEPLLLVESANTKVEVERCRIGNSTAFVTGRVIVNIPFKTQSSTDTSNGATIVCGGIRHCTAFIPFELEIDLPGAQVGDQCRVLSACLTDLVLERIGNDRLDVTAEVCVRVQTTREQTVDILGTVQPTNRFVTFPSFR
jgi:hypothetical protein